MLYMSNQTGNKQIRYMEYDPNLESDSFTLKVVRELVKRKMPKERWLETQNNERLVHELYLLLRNDGTTVRAEDKKGPQSLRARS